MVTNLPPQAEAQYKKVVASKSKEEKLENLKIFLSMIPEHKGTEKLRAQVKRQIARLQDEIILEKKRRSSRQVTFDKGDNTILTIILTRDKSLLCDFLFRTRLFEEESILESLNELKPLSVSFEDVNISLMPISTSLIENQNRRYSLIQTVLLKSDLILVLLGKSEPYKEYQQVREMLSRFGIYIASRNSVAVFKPLNAGGITVVNKSRFLEEDEIRKFLAEQGYESGIVNLSEYTSLYTLESSIRGLQRRNFLMLLEGDFDEDKLAGELKAPPEHIVKTEVFLRGDFLKKIFEVSEIMRIYLKPPSAKTPSEKPMLVNKEITVGELASKIHLDLSQSLKYARLWRGGFKSTPLKVSPSFKLLDKDVVELRTR
ncbi:MAG: TGS domain-containing protein [Candidatus Brockarchaeota archaeon]|nr:TGS domain-containing protein [Candidatus Brockarchaeota archaeon]